MRDDVAAGQAQAGRLGAHQLEGGPHRAHHQVRLVAGYAVGAGALHLDDQPVGRGPPPRARHAGTGRGRGRRSPDRGWPRWPARTPGPGPRRRWPCSGEPGGGSGRVHVGVDDRVDEVGVALQRGRGVLEPVPGDRDDDRLRRRSISPAASSLSRPATPAAEAGSTKTPSRRASSACAARICASVTASKRPSDSLAAISASCQEAGLPMRIAVAMVSGSGNGSPVTSGAAPSAWKPHITGRRVARPSSAYCW